MAQWHELTDGGALFWSQGEARDAFRLIVVRSGDAVFGYVNRCAHFGVPLAEKLEKLIFMPHDTITCNVHYARYGWRDGACRSGECDGEGLLRVPLRVEAGEVCIDG